MTCPNICILISIPSNARKKQDKIYQNSQRLVVD